MSTSKTISQSIVETRHIIMPNHTNPQDNVFGGIIMSWIDLAAAMVAERHTEMDVLTLHVDEILFREPMKIGHHAVIKASIHYVGRTSLLVGVDVYSEDPKRGTKTHATTAFLTFVAINAEGVPSPIPRITLQNEDEKLKFNLGEKRVKRRKHDNTQES